MDIVRVTDAGEIAPLFQGWPECMLRAALDGCMGELYANEARTAAQIVVADFCFLAGDAASAEAEALAMHAPASLHGAPYVIAPRNADWCAVVERALGDRAVRGERYAIRKDAHRFDRAALEAYADALPEGFALAVMDGALYRKALQAEWSRDLVSQFEGETDYRNRGLGVMALREGEPVAGASSYVVFHGGIEIEIDTRREYRRLGLATACGAKLILLCLERGLYPSWDAYSRASVALAEKLGYVEDHPYAVYTVGKQPEAAPGKG